MTTRGSSRTTAAAATATLRLQDEASVDGVSPRNSEGGLQVLLALSADYKQNQTESTQPHASVCVLLHLSFLARSLAVVWCCVV